MNSSATCVLGFAALIGLVSPGKASGQADTHPASSGLTAVAGVKVGHYTLSERPTGCTVVLVEGGAVGGVDSGVAHQGRERPTYSIQ